MIAVKGGYQVKNISKQIKKNTVSRTLKINKYIINTNVVEQQVTSRAAAASAATATTAAAAAAAGPATGGRR